MLLEVIEIERDREREGVLLEGVAFAVGVVGADVAEFIFEPTQPRRDIETDAGGVVGERLDGGQQAG